MQPVIDEASAGLAEAVAMEEHKHEVLISEVEKVDVESPVQSNKPLSLHDENEITRIPTDSTVQPEMAVKTQSIYHIYEETPLDKCISPVMDPTREKWLGPSLKEQKTKSLQKKERKSSGLPPVEPDDAAFYMHQPYLSFHLPPSVLYMGSSKDTAKPAVLVHEACLWKKYKIQLGPSISKPGVIDPRGVVSWYHNGGKKKDLKADDHKLKGYKVRGWRLWGETGKEYVHTVKANRRTGEGPDPDVFNSMVEKPALAEEVVYLRWISPLSRSTRRYHFHYMGIDFYWKGTASVREPRTCGFLLRFNHLKLIAKLPIVEDKSHDEDELCLGKYACSIACKKSGTLEFFDTAILRLIDEYLPSILDLSSEEEEDESQEHVENDRVLRLRKSRLYQVFVATAICMIKSEKEKRHTLMELLVAAAEGGAA